MIQDIAPHIYNNAFNARREPEDSDLVLICRENQILLRREEEISFPSVGEILRAAGGAAPDPGSFDVLSVDEQTEPRGGSRRDGEDGTYLRGGIPFVFLFLIDDTAYYGVDDESENWAELLPGCVFLPFGELRGAVPNHLAFAGITGAQLWRWRQDRKFCGRCGARMRPSRTERAFECDACGSVVYPKISPAVIVAVTHGDKILLTKYAGRAYTRYALVAGFAEIGETIEETVHREVMEETGVRVKNLRFYKSQPWSFSDTLLMGFYCDLDGEDEAITLDETELDVGTWMQREEMPERSGDISLTGEMMEQFRLGLNP